MCLKGKNISLRGLGTCTFLLSAGVKKKVAIAVSTNRTEYKAGTKRHPPGMIPPTYEPPIVLAMTAGPINFVADDVPSYSLIDNKYKTPEMIEYNQWFYCDMLKLIETYQNKIQCWIYGHTHTPSINTIHQIPFLCNPIGYPNENYNLYFQLPNIVHELRL